MLMALFAVEGYMLVVNGLGPFLIMVFKSDGSGKGFEDIEKNTYASIRGIPSLLGGS